MISLPRTRPAETTAGVAAALSVLLCAIFGVDDPVVYGALVIVIGFLPAVITWIVTMVRDPNGTTFQRP